MQIPKIHLLIKSFPSGYSIELIAYANYHAIKWYQWYWDYLSNILYEMNL